MNFMQTKLDILDSEWKIMKNQLENSKHQRFTNKEPTISQLIQKTTF